MNQTYSHFDCTLFYRVCPLLFSTIDPKSYGKNIIKSFLFNISPQSPLQNMNDIRSLLDGRKKKNKNIGYCSFSKISKSIC